MVWNVDMDPVSDTFAKVQAFKTAHGLTYPLALDVNRKTTPYDSGYIPTLYIIDREGIVQYYEVGFDEAGLISKIEALLAQEPPGPTFELRLNKMDMTPYQSGDIMTLFADVTNSGAAMPVVVYVAVEIDGEIFFWPSYSKIMEGSPLILSEGLSLTGYVLVSVRFNETFPHGTFTWYGVLANPLNGEWITEPSVVHWTYGAASPN